MPARKGLFVRFSGFLCEVAFAYAAERAFEIFGEIFPLGAGSDAEIFGAFFFVIDPSAYITYILHSYSSCSQFLPYGGF